MKYYGQVRVPVEFHVQSSVEYQDAFQEIEVDAVVKDGQGNEWKIPAFYMGGRKWGIRFAAPSEGEYTFQCVCTNPEDDGINSEAGEIHITAYTGSNPLYIHGAIKTEPGKRYMMYEDGTPFPWLADTWWMVMSRRIKYPDDLNVMIKDRVEKGFTVIQLVNGLWCDCNKLDVRCENEAGYCWKGEYETLNPEYYNLADMKVQAIVEAGLHPFMLSCWGFYVRYMGVKKLKQHIRNMIARWGAYPILWCAAGETTMLPYLDGGKQSEIQEERKNLQQRAEWTELTKYLRETDPYKRTVTTHPMGGSVSLDEINDYGELQDFYTYQASHVDDHQSICAMTKGFDKQLYDTEPVKPFINMESNYEGMIDGLWNGPLLLRYIFWNTMLDGGAGYSYGAQGVWNASSEEEPFGASPYGMNWGNWTWKQGYQAPGSAQMGMGRKILDQFEWWRLQPAGDLVQNAPISFQEDFYKIVGAYIPDELFIIYKNYPNLMVGVMQNSDDFCARVSLPKGQKYSVTFINPVDGREESGGIAEADENGIWLIKQEPVVASEWVVVLKRIN